MITPEDIYKAGCAKLTMQVPDYSQLSEESQAFYTAMADYLNRHVLRIHVLQERMLALEALVRDYVDFTKFDAPTVRKWANEWRELRDQLAERAKALGEP